MAPTSTKQLKYFSNTNTVFPHIVSAETLLFLIAWIPILMNTYCISANSFCPWIVSALLCTVSKGHRTQGQIQKRIVSAETICGNTVSFRMKHLKNGSYFSPHKTVWNNYIVLYFQLSNLKLLNPDNTSLYSIVHREENDANKRFLMSSCRRSTYVSTHSDLKFKIPFVN